MATHAVSGFHDITSGYIHKEIIMRALILVPLVLMLGMGALIMGIVTLPDAPTSPRDAYGLFHPFATLDSSRTSYRSDMSPAHTNMLMFEDGSIGSRVDVNTVCSYTRPDLCDALR